MKNFKEILEKSIKSKLLVSKKSFLRNVMNKFDKKSNFMLQSNTIKLSYNTIKKFSIKIISRTLDENSPTESCNTENIRNIGIIAHIDAGKTTTTERMLLYSGIIENMGEVHDGNTTTDYMQQERDRGITIRAAAISFKWRDHQVNLIDTPGHIDFTAEVERSLKVMDSAVLIFDSSMGVETQTVTVYKQAEKYRLPLIGFINKIDKIGSDFAKTLYEMNKKLRCNPLLISYPIGEDSNIKGIVDLISMKYLTFSGLNGEKINRQDVNESEDCEKYLDNIKKTRDRLLEELSKYNDEIIENLLENRDPSIDTIIDTIRKSTIERKIVPTLCGSSLKNKGVQQLLDSIIVFLPSPLDCSDIEVNENNTKTKLNKQDVLGFIYKIIFDNNLGSICYFKLYSGELKKGSIIKFTSPNILNRQEKINQILRIKADKFLQLDVINAGDIGAFVGLKNIESGISFTSVNGKNQYLDPIFIPDPVFFCSIYSKSSANANLLKKVLSQIAIEDPSLRIKQDKETSQTIISGLGELHLEIIKDRIELEYEIKTTLGKMKVTFRESIKSASTLKKVLNKVFDKKDLFFEIEITISRLNSKYVHKLTNEFKEEYNLPDEFSEENFEDLFNYIPSNNCLVFNEYLLLDKTSKVQQNELGQEENLKSLNQIKPINRKELLTFIEEIINQGALLGFPLLNIKLDIKSGYYSQTKTSSLAMKICLTEALKEAVRNSKPALLEPFMYVETKCSNTYSNTILNEINKRKGQIDKITSEVEIAKEISNFNYEYLLDDKQFKNDLDREIQTKIISYIPLTEMIGYSAFIRSATKGEAIYFMEFSHYDFASPELEDKVISGEYFYE